MIISSDIIEFKNNIIQTVYTASEIKKHIITSITKNDEEPIIQKTRIIKSIKEKLFTLDENIKVYPGHGESTTIGRERSCNPFYS